MTPLPATGTRIRALVDATGGGLNSPPRTWFHRRMLRRGYPISRRRCDAILDGHEPPTDRFVRTAAKVFNVPASALEVTDAEWNRTAAWLADIQSALQNRTTTIVCRDDGTAEFRSDEDK